jgi:hypothetical protein
MSLFCPKARVMASVRCRVGFIHVRVLTFVSVGTQSSVRPPTDLVYALDAHHTHRNWSLLQRFHDHFDCDSGPIHRIFPKEFGRVQQCVSKRQAWSYRLWNRLRMDMGCHAGKFSLGHTMIDRRPTLPAAPIQCRCVQIRYFRPLVVRGWCHCPSPPLRAGVYR